MHLETIEAAKYEMLADLKRAAAPPTPASRDRARLERIPMGKSQTPSTIGEGPTDIDVVVEIEDRPQKIRKRRLNKVHVVGSWSSQLCDTPSKEGEDESYRYPVTQ